jgi:hypothetical protein
MPILAILKVYPEEKIISHHEKRVITIFAAGDAVKVCENFLQTTTPSTELKQSTYNKKTSFYFNEKTNNRHYHVEKEKELEDCKYIFDDGFYVIVRDRIGSDEKNQKVFLEITRIERINKEAEKDSTKQIQKALATFIKNDNKEEKRIQDRNQLFYSQSQPNNSWGFLCCKCDSDDDKDYHVFRRK